MKEHKFSLHKFVDIAAVAVTLRDDRLLDYLLERFVIDDSGATPKLTNTTISLSCRIALIQRVRNL
jgi:hypothetical protein